MESLASRRPTSLSGDPAEGTREERKQGDVVNVSMSLSYSVTSLPKPGGQMVPIITSDHYPEFYLI